MVHHYVLISVVHLFPLFRHHQPHPPTHTHPTHTPPTHTHFHIDMVIVISNPFFLVPRNICYIGPGCYQYLLYNNILDVLNTLANIDATCVHVIHEDMVHPSMLIKLKEENTCEL